MFNMPNLYKLSLFNLALFIFILNILIKIIPIIKDIIDINIPLVKLYFNKTNNDSGIKSVILIPIIMDREKLKTRLINLFMFSFLIGRKIINEPIIVDRPAIVEIIKGRQISI
jgi:hypothetical protein